MVAHLMPALCGPDGLPRSWRHFVYARQYLARHHARETLLMAQATRIANTTGADWRTAVQSLVRYAEGV